MIKIDTDYLENKVEMCYTIIYDSSTDIIK